MENIGIRFTLEDFRSIFNHLDFDNTGTLDFHKFSLINSEKSLENSLDNKRE